VRGDKLRANNFLNIYMHVCVFIYTNYYTQHTHLLCERKLLFWMRLIAINLCTALIMSQ